MDKETLSHYGWIVVLVMILAVLLAFATPFGTFIADGFKATYAGFDMVGTSAMDVVMNSTGGCTHKDTEVKNVTDDYTGDTVCDKCDEIIEKGKHIVPEGGVYYVGVTDNRTAGTYGDYTVYTAKYLPGDELPEVVNDGDIYRYKEYEYRYNQSVSHPSNSDSTTWSFVDGQNGWGVHVIAYYNFSGREPMLAEVNGKPITSIRNTHYKCSGLRKALPIPETVTNMHGAFERCSNLTDLSDLNIPVGVTNLNTTFKQCTSLVDASVLDIPSTVETMGSTFYQCYLLTKSPELPEGLTNMSSTYWECKALPDSGVPKIPSTVTNMSSTFARCETITVAPAVPSKVVNLQSTFSGCISMKDISAVIIPNTVTNMDGTFRDCRYVVDASHIVIPASEPTPHGTFSGCISLVDTCMPTLSDGITSLGGSFSSNGTFYGCSSLKDLSKYKIPSTVTDIGYTFAGCSSLVVAPEIIQCSGLKYMNHTFMNCSSLLASPQIPDCVSRMNNAFQNCTSLTDAGMPKLPTQNFTVAYAFAGCTSLVDLSNYSIYGNSVYTLSANNVFEGCTNLVKAPTFGGFGLSTVANGLKGCTSLTGDITLNISRLSLFTYDGFLDGVDFDKQNISLVGTSKWIDDLGETGINYCRECNGRHKNANEVHTCHGGNATCQQKAICMICNKTYGDFAPCNTSNGKCTLCNKTVTTIQSKHDPYDANQNYVVLGTWDYSDAKSVNITVIHQMENADYDWFSITSGKDYVSGQSQNQTRTYLSKDGNLIQNVGNYYAVKFCDYYQSGVVTKTFENVDMLTGSVIFKTSDNASSFYGATVIITPNY